MVLTFTQSADLSKNHEKDFFSNFECFSESPNFNNKNKFCELLSGLPAKWHSQSSPIWVKIDWIGCKNIYKVSEFLVIYNLWQLDGKLRLFALVKIETELIFLNLKKLETLQPNYRKFKLNRTKLHCHSSL